jgi:hypothetical protein
MEDMYPDDTYQDTYPDDTYQDMYPDDYYAPEPRQRTTGWMIAFFVLLILAAACCICLCAATLLLGPAVGTTFSTIVETIEAITPMP